MESEIPHHFHGSPGTTPYCIPEGDVLYVTSSYPYEKLSRSTNFRILKLFPRSFVPPFANQTGTPRSRCLHVELTEHELSAAPNYECLSYTWGDDHHQSLVWLDTFFLVPIGANLDMALRCLQHETEPRYLWVDYLCINQKDLDERNQQVQLMYSIYSSAQSVTAYLGSEADGSQNIPSILGRIIKAHWRDDPPTQDFWTEEEYEERGLPPADSKEWNTLQKFMARPWFSRAWILQEALAARDLKIRCGLWQSEALQLCKGIAMAFLHRLPVGGKLHAGEDVLEYPAGRGSRQWWLMTNMGLCGIIPPRSDLHLIDIVEGARRARAGDPRDKVYAMLNICPSSHDLGIEPDYALETPAVYKLLAQKIVAAGQGHRLLLSCGILGSALDLPSWVPDWSIEKIPYNSVVAPWAAHGPDQHGDSRTSESTIRLGKNLNELLITVTGLGTVAYVEPLYTYERNPPYYVDTQLSSNDSDPNTNTVAGGSLVPDNPVNASANSLRTPCSRSNSDSDLSWDRYPKLFRLYATAFQLISKSPVYKYTNHLEVVWKTLLCNHAGSLEGGQPDDYCDHAQSYYGFTKYVYSDTGGRAQYRKTVLDRIKDAHPKFAADTLTQQEVVEYVWRFNGYMELQERRSREFSQALTKFCYTLRLACTNTGFVGMVPPNTTNDDIVIYVVGMEAPLVVRKTDKENQYVLVGPAFFHGFMAGEAPLQELLDSVVVFQDIVIA